MGREIEKCYKFIIRIGNVVIGEILVLKIVFSDIFKVNDVFRNGVTYSYRYDVAMYVETNTMTRDLKMQIPSKIQGA